MISARHIMTMLRGSGYFRIPLPLEDGDRIDLVESIYVPSNCILEGFGYRSRLHCTGAFPAFVFENLDASPSVNVVLRDLRATNEDEEEIRIGHVTGTNGTASGVWLPTIEEAAALIAMVAS